MLHHDPSYTDLEHDEQLALRDRREDHCPASLWVRCFPAYAARVDTDARARFQEYRARRDTAPRGQGVKSMPRSSAVPADNA